MSFNSSFLEVHAQEWDCWVNGISIFNFLRTFYKVLYNGCTSLNSHQQFKKVPFSPQPLQQLHSKHFNHGQSDQCEMIPQCGFDLHFSYDKWCWAAFLCLLVICVSSFVFLSSICSWVLRYMSSFHILENNFFVSFPVAIIFSQLWRLQFSSVQFSSILPSSRVFSNESNFHMSWPKYWSFIFSISPSKETPELMSFRMHWLDLLAVQRTLKSLLQHHSPKASVLRCSTFFTVQLSHPYMTTGKTIATIRRIFVGKVMSLLFNILSSLVIIFLPRSRHLLISWLQSPSAVILEPQKIKSDTVSTVYLSISHKVMGLDAMIFVFGMLSFKSTFPTLHYHFHQEAFLFLFTFCHKGAVISISEVIDISLGNLDSCLCFFQPSISYDVCCLQV